MNDHSQPLAILLNSVRRRHLLQVAVEQTAVALGAAFAGAVLLLVLGTGILDWYWLVIVFGASLGLGLWRMIRRIPSRYRLAQIVDARMHLDDTLSTVLFFESGGRQAAPELLAYERAVAEKLVRGVSAALVIPLRLPKTFFAVAGIALVAFGMFALRYGVTRSLDLRPSLVKIAFDTFWKQENAALDRKNPLRRAISDELKKLGISLSVPDEQPRPQDGAQESALRTPDGPDVRNAESGDNGRAKANLTPEDRQPGDGEASEKGERATGNADQDPDAGQPPSPAQAAARQDPGRKNAPKDEKSNLLDRMRDAMANLLNKLKIQPQGPENRQQTAQESKSGSAAQQAQKGAPAPGKPQANGAESPDQQGEQQPGQDAQNARGKAGDKNGDRQASRDSKNGIGREDGDKSAREAEQLAAMGKLSQILGRRAQNMSGELMVEVAGGNQQLKTAYSSTVGKHTASGGEITRDEVPLIYRDYVQQYFARIRKTPPPAAAAKKTAGAVE